MRDPVTGVQVPAGEDVLPEAAPAGTRPVPYRRTWPRFLVVLLVLLLLVLIGVSGLVGLEAWSAQKEWNQAEAAIRLHRFDEALGHLSNYLGVWKNSAPAHYLTAQTARRAGQYDLAEDHLAHCQRLGWNPEAIKQERYLIQAQQGYITPELEQYLVPRTRKELNNPDAALICEALVKGYLRTYQVSTAQQALDRWLDYEPDNVEALLWRAWVLNLRFDRQAAYADLQHAVDCDPDNEEARLRLGECLLALGPPDAAAAQLLWLYERLPDQPAVVLNLAVYYRSQGKKDETQRLLDRVLADRHYAELLRDRLQGKHRLPESLSPETRQWVQQAIVLATPEARQADHLVGLYVAALEERAALALDQGKTTPAEGWLRQGLRIMPSEPQLHYLLAQCLEKQGRRSQAREERDTWQALKQKQKELDQVGQKVAVSPHDSALRAEAARLHFELGHEREALRWLDSILKDEPQYTLPEQTLRRLEAYYEQSQDPDALQLLAAFRRTP